MEMSPIYIGLPTGVQGPAFQLPEHLLDAYTLKGRIAVMQFWLGRKIPNNVLRWSRAEFDRISAVVAAAVREKAVIGYGSDPQLFEALNDHPIAGQEILIIGSETPLYECIALHFGGRPVTVEYSPIEHDIDGLQTFTPEEFARDHRRFDGGMSISAIEHSGLGRYGDQLDPLGDLRAMQEYRRRLKVGGRLVLQVPAGFDAVYWNAHRVYGGIRLPLLLKGWRVLACYGLDYPGLGNLPMRPYDVAEPVFVLENTDEPLQLLGPDDLASEPQARVFIYGAGRGGALVRTMLEGGGRTVAGYVDSARSGSHEDLPLIQVDDFLAQRRADDIVIVASQYIQDILPRLAVLPPDRVLSAEIYMAHFV